MKLLLDTNILLWSATNKLPLAAEKLILDKSNHLFFRYVRTQGKGRVCVLTPGHTHDVWGNSHFQVLLENAVRWCGNKSRVN